MSHGLAMALLCISVAIANCGSPSQNSGNNLGPPSSSPASSLNMPCPTPADPNLKIVITAPCSDTRVKPRHFVEGVVMDPNAQVFVVIHPIVASDYWVQPNVTVREKGKWKVLCYFGEIGQQHTGAQFEVMAFANPRQNLREGQLLDNWPEAESKSQVTQAIRE